MEELIVGHRYKHKINNKECVINNCQPRGRGYQICYIPDGYVFGLVTSRKEFLNNFERIKN